MVTSLRSKWAAGWGSVSAGRRNGVTASDLGNKAAFRNGYIYQEVSTKPMALSKRPYAHTPSRRYVSPAAGPFSTKPSGALNRDMDTNGCPFPDARRHILGNGVEYPSTKPPGFSFLPKPNS
jgi:hypothetical protein